MRASPLNNKPQTPTAPNQVAGEHHSAAPNGSAQGGQQQQSQQPAAIVKPSVILTEAAKEKAMKAKAYIESKYRKMDAEDRERNEGK
jgi:hypothetical protein